jgi:hypothetical protein
VVYYTPHLYIMQVRAVVLMDSKDTVDESIDQRN